MSDPFFAEATIAIRPDLRKFVTDLRTQVKAAVETVEGTPATRVRIAPALTRNFVGELRRQANIAVAQASRGLAPLQVRAVVAPLTRRQLAAFQGAAATGVPVAVTPTVAPAAVGGTTEQGARANETFAETQRRVNAFVTQGAVDLGVYAAAQEVSTVATQEATVASQKKIQQAANESRALTTLGRAEEKVATARLAGEGTSERTQALRAARRLLPTAGAQATASEVATVRDLTADLTKEITGMEEAERQLTQTTTQSNVARQIAIGTTKASTKAKITELKSTKDLAGAQLQFATATRGLLGPEDQLRQMRGAGVRAALAVEQAEREIAAARSPTATFAAVQAQRQALAVSRDIQRAIDSEVAARERQGDALRAQRAAVAASNKALREQQADLTRSARSQAQLRRGAFATGLSFLGIRGATLAASASFLVGAASLTVFAKALQNASRFSDQLNVFRATTGATATELERVRDSARALGADITLPGVTAADAAESMTELAKAGLSVQESIDGARGVLQLATAAAIQNAQAVELAANAINAFQLSGRDATRVADTFANAANAAQGSIVDIGIAFQQASAAGRQVGLSFEDTTTFLTVLARAGLRGSDAGTSLRTALLRLIRPTEAARDRMRELGIETRDAAGNLRPDVFLQITAATRELSPAARDAAIALIGGQDAFRAITILGRQSIGEFIKLRRELREQGTASELAAARAQGLRGSIEALSNTLNTAGIRIGQSVTPSIQGLVEGLTAGAAAMAESDQVARTFAGAIDTVDLSLDALGGTLSLVGPPLLAIASAFEQVANVVGVPTILAAVAAYKLLPPIFIRVTAAATGTRAATLAVAAALSPSTFAITALRSGVAALASNLNLVAIAAVAATAAIVFLATRESEAERATRRLKEATDELAGSLEAARTAGRQATELGLGVNATALGVLQAREAAGAARAALADTKAGRGTFERRKLVLELAVALDDVAAAEERYRQAIEDAAEARAAASQAGRNAIADQGRFVDSIEDTVEAQRGLFRLGSGETVAGRTAGANANEFRERAIRNVTEALREQAAAAREENTADSRRLARRLELLAEITAEVDRMPTRRAIQIAVNAPNAQAALRRIVREFGITGKAAQDALIAELSGPNATQRIRTALVGTVEGLAEAFREAGLKLGKTAGEGIKDGITEQQGAIRNALLQTVTRTRGRRRGLESAALDIEIAGGSPAEILANLREQQAVAEQELAAQRQRFRRGDITGAALAASKADLARIINEIQSAEDEMAADARQAADDAKQKREDRDQALLEALGFSRDRAQERIQDAQITETLRDDIRRTQQLRRIIAAQIKTIRDRIKSASVRIEAIRELRKLDRDLQRELRQLQQQRQENIRERAAEHSQLNIELAQTTENRAAEVRARQAEIRRLRRLLDDTKKGTLAYKRLRNAIAEQQAAIKDLKEQEEDRRRSFQEMAFEFLQSQQGFAANLFGNLIPSGMTGGLVGGQATANRPPLPDQRLEQVRQQQAVATAGAVGPSRGQAAVEIDVLRQILGVLHDIRSGRDHPEARRQHVTGGASMDVL